MRVYLDHHATTPCDPRVVAAMQPWWSERFGNAASKQHAWGRDARGAVEQARREVAALLGGSPKEVVFTSGATEALNLAIGGLARKARPERRRVVTSAVEHRAVLELCEHLHATGAVEHVVVGVDPGGRVRLDELEDAVDERTLAVAVMAANNEVGTLMPLAAVGAICRASGARFVVDAAQAVGKVPVDLEASGADLVALSGHKLYGPKGVGALWIRRRPPVRLEPLLFGGGHERGLRPGTLPVPLLVGLGAACDLARSEVSTEATRVAPLRDRLLAALQAGCPGLLVNGTMAERLPNNLNVSFPGIEGARLLELLAHEVALSSGSACTTDELEPSHVLRALGMSDALVYSAVRMGLGRWTTEAEIDFAAQRIVEAVGQLRR